MGSLDWMRCYWCDYWVDHPYIYDFFWDDYGALCDWCMEISTDEALHPDYHWWCRQPNRRGDLYYVLQEAGFDSTVAWLIVAFAVAPHAVAGSLAVAG